LAFADPYLLNVEGKWVFTFDNFIKIGDMITDPIANTLGLSVKNTLKYFFNMVLVNTPLCLFVAFFFYKKIFGYKIYRVIFYLPGIIPSLAYVSAFQEILYPGGPFNYIINLLGIGHLYPKGGFFASSATATNTILIYCIYTGLTTNVLLFTSAMSRIPTEILEAAKLDGVGPARELFMIIFPLIWPTFSTQLIFMMTGLFSSSGPILLFTNGEKGTSTIAYWIFSKLYGSGGGGATPAGYANVASLGLCLTAILVPIIMLSRKLVEKVETFDY
jgi:ABC-type sugar transport system permease subunit